MLTADVIICILLTTAAATYLPWPGTGQGSVGIADPPSDKSNSVEEVSPQEPRRPLFRHDADVRGYLKGYGRQLMIWQCRNAIQFRQFTPIRHVDLHCDVIGTMKTVSWSLRGHKIAGTGVELSAGVVDNRRYSYTISTHYDGETYYSTWLDFQLRIYNATTADSGVYRFRVTSPSGDSDQRLVYLDISAPPTASTTPNYSDNNSISGSGSAGEEGKGRRSRLEKQRRRRNRKRRRRLRKKLERQRRRLLDKNTSRRRSLNDDVTQLHA